MTVRLVRRLGLMAAALVLSETMQADAWVLPSLQGRQYSLAVDPEGNLLAGPISGKLRKLDGETGKERWAANFDGGPHVDPAGDVYISDTDAECGFCTVVAKLSGTDGAVLWTQESFTTAGITEIHPGSAGSAGGVFLAVGAVLTKDVVKLDASSGAVLWQRPSIGIAHALDGAGDLIVVRRDGSTSHLVATKLSGATGATIWETDTGEVLGGPGAIEVGPVAVDGAGDVFVTRSYPTSAIFKLDGTTGAELWRVSPPAFLRAVDSNGDLLLGDGDDAIWKLAGDSGMALWSAPGEGVLVVLPGDDALVIAHYDGTLTRYRGSDGMVLWQHPLFGGEISLSTVYDVVLGPRGLFVSGASFFGDPRDLLIGLAARLEGRSLVLRDDPANPARSVLAVLATDALFHPPGPAGAGPDPTVNGASVTIANPVTLEAGTIPLPAGNWTVKETTAFGRYSYAYADPVGSSPRCRATLRSPGKLKLKCIGTLGGFTLDEPSQGGLEITVTVGTGGHDYCLAFGGDVVLDAGSGSNAKGVFKARKAGPATDCPGGF